MAAGDTHELLTVALALLPHAVGVGYLLVLIDEEGEGQVELGLEGLVGLDAVRAHAKDDGVLLLDLRVGVAEATGLDRTAAGIVLRIEVKDDLLAAEVLEAHLVVLVV